MVPIMVNLILGSRECLSGQKAGCVSSGAVQAGNELLLVLKLHLGYCRPES